MISQVVVESFFFNGHAGGTATGDADLFRGSTKMYLTYAQDQLTCYETLTIHADGAFLFVTILSFNIM